MMKRLAVFVLLFLAACAPIAVTPPAAVPPTPLPALTVDQVKNAQVSLTTLTNDTALSYQLTGGVFQKGTDPAGASYAMIRLLDPIVLGDLNGDGLGDAAALIAENYGGTGVFVSLLAFVNEGGRAVQAAAFGVDDRPVINSLDLQDGVIGLDATVHSAMDPMCCPSFGTRQHFRLYGTQLVMMDYASQTPSGQWRSITVTSPAAADRTQGSVEISGTVSIAPFENSLSWNLVDAKGNELASGPVMVKAMDMGAPGTFQVTVPLDHAPAGAPAWIVIHDLSAADSSLLALAAVPVQ